MINIRVLSVLLFSVTLQCHDIELRIPDLSETNIDHIKKLGQNYPGKTMKIEVIPETTFFEKIKRNITGENGSKSKGEGGSVSSRAAFMYFIKSCFGTTAVSYFSIAYVIYRAYKIAKKINLWFKEDEEEKDDMNTIERMLFKNKKYKLSNIEMFYLNTYITLHKQLRLCGLRNYFSVNKKLDKIIFLCQNTQPTV